MPEEPLRGTLFDEHVALGARMGRFGAHEMPVSFIGVEDEVLATRSSAGAFDLGHRATFRVFGFAAARYLQALLTNDLGRIARIGDSQRTLMCDEAGGIVDDIVAYRSGDLEYLLMASPSSHAEDLAWFASRCPAGIEIAWGVGDTAPGDAVAEIADESDRTGLIGVQGPLALEVVRELAGPGFEPPMPGHLGEAMLGSVPVLLARAGSTGEDGVEAACRAADAPALWRALLSFPEVTPCGLDAADVLRLEMGRPALGAELGRDVDPIAAGLESEVALGKAGGFVGHDAIERIREQGPIRRLVGLRVPGGVPVAGDPVLHGEREVGKVSSGTLSPTLGEGIALAYVPVELAGEGTGLVVRTQRGVLPARVTEPPFVKDTSLPRGPEKSAAAPSRGARGDVELSEGAEVRQGARVGPHRR